jgi:predicted nuclease of restriction endonuclease-like RecB superfamily
LSPGDRLSSVLTKDLLRVSRAGGGYHPQFTDAADESLAARVLGIYQGHVGERRARLSAALTELEREADEFKLVRGFAKLLEREATFETRAPLDPRRARTTAFETAEAAGVVTETEREAALSAAADRLGATVADVESSLFADRERQQVLTGLETRYDPESLREQYDLSLAQTALFDATSVRVRSSDPKALVSAVKRLRLLYEIRRTGEGRDVVVTGPDALFRRSRRYGTRFARLLRTVAATAEWRLEATIDDRGTERRLELETGDVSVPGTEPVAEPTFDSGVESDFYARFEALDLEWTLHREPEPLAAGEHVVIPDFAFAYNHADFRVFFEIMGFWTPEYVEKKLSRFADLEDVAFLVAYDESLGVGEAIEAEGHRAIPYAGTVRLKDVRDALRPYEERLAAESAERVPETLAPEADVVTIEDLADEYGVPESVVEDAAVPEHERVGRTFVRPPVLQELSGAIERGMALAEVEALLEERGIDDASATLSALGYRIEWEGLGGGTVREA